MTSRRHRSQLAPRLLDLALDLLPIAFERPRHAARAEVAIPNSRRLGGGVCEPGVFSMTPGVVTCSLARVILPAGFRPKSCPDFPLFVTDLCTLVEAAQTGLFDRRNVHEYVFATVVGLNEPVPLGGIKPFNSTCSHVVSPIEVRRPA